MSRMCARSFTRSTSGGFDSLDPEQRGGRPRRITDEQRARIVAVAGARPDTLGVPATRWSLKRLARYLREQRIVQVSPAHLGRVLAEAGLSFQRTRTWKASPDPEYEAKAARILELKAAPPPDGGHVIAFEQMGPISLRPMAGAGWAPHGRPERQRATYHRTLGTRYVFGAYDVHDDRLRVRLSLDPPAGCRRSVRWCAKNDLLSREKAVVSGGPGPRPGAGRLVEGGGTG